MPTITLTNIYTANKATQVEKNIWANMTYGRSIDFISPYDINTPWENLTNQSSINVIVERQTTGLRLMTVEDSTTPIPEFLNEDLPTVQITCDSSFYDYVFLDNGTLTIIQDTGIQTYDYGIGVMYQVVDPTTLNVLATWQLSNVFTSLPLQDLLVQVKEVEFYPITDPTDITHSIVGGYVEFDVEYSGVTGTTSIIRDLPNLSITNNPITLIADSTLKYTNNMRYYFTTYDAFDNKIITSSIYPNIEGNSYGYYDVSNIYNNYVTTDQTSFSNSGNIQLSNMYSYTVNVTDNVNLDGITSDKKYCINGATPYGSFFDYTEYTMSPTDNYKLDRKFLTSWVGDRLTNYDDFFSINYIKGKFNAYPVLEDEINVMKITKYSKGDTYPYTGFADDRVGYIRFTDYNVDNEVYNIGIGYKNLDNAFNSNLITDVNNVLITDNFLVDADYYTIQLFYELSASFTPRSEIIKVYIDKNCTSLYYTNLLYKDMLGNYNSISFFNKNNKNYNLTRNSVRNNYYSLKIDEYTYNIGDRGDFNAQVNKIESHNVQSSWISDNMMKNIIELISSNDVYQVINGEIYPIIITSNSITEKNVKNDRLFQTSLTYNMAYEINTNN